MNLDELLAANGITTALIVDDVFDLVPTASDIDPGNDAWPTFNDDLTPEQRDLIAEEYPRARDEHFGNLIAEDGYVATVWRLRGQLGPVADPVFETYLRDQASDLSYVEVAQRKLEAAGLACSTAGREFADKTRDVDLVLIDLYFGNAQDDHALRASMVKLREALKPRAGKPPLVILMSRSSRLEGKRDEFRDEVGLVESAFRIVRKAELETTDRLEVQLQRLVESVVDSMNLARFFHAIEEGINQAAERTLTLMRKLKLSDVGQIQQLLLDAEGSPTGSYLVDVFDRVLQHEIERDGGIIEAACALNSISTEDYPPPHVAGSAELQELVQRMLTQNENRLQLPGSLESVVTFGDVLRMPVDADAERLKRALLVDLKPENVLLVLTPGCDLQRNEAPRVLLLVGVVKPVGVGDWTYTDDARTPAIRIDGELQWVKWNLKHIDTASQAQLKAAQDAGDIRTVARLRDAHAIELQQRVLSGLGRVGLVAPLPATFPVDVTAYYADSGGRLAPLDVPGLADEAVCFVGRDAKNPRIIRLVLTEKTCDDVQKALEDLRDEDVAEHARRAFGHVKSTPDLRRRMASGIDLKNLTPGQLAGIPSEAGTKSPLPYMGLVAWNYEVPEAALDRKELQKAGIVFVVKDTTAQGAPGLNDVIRSGVVDPAPAPAPDDGAEGGGG